MINPYFEMTMCHRKFVTKNLKLPCGTEDLKWPCATRNLKWLCATENLRWPCATENLRWLCATGNLSMTFCYQKFKMTVIFKKMSNLIFRQSPKTRVHEFSKKCQTSILTNFHIPGYMNFQKNVKLQFWPISIDPGTWIFKKMSNLIFGQFP